jgi:hypothetical protein
MTAAALLFRWLPVMVERGFRLFPLAVDRLWGDVFVDGGAAWCPGSCQNLFGPVPSSPEPLVSVGAEARVKLRAGYFEDYPLRFGAALPLTTPPSRVRMEA